LVSLVQSEARGAVAGNISMAFLEPVVFLNVVQIIPSDDDSPLHFGGLDDAFQNAASNMDIAGERALLIHIHTVDGGWRGLEAQTNSFVGQSLYLFEDGGIYGTDGEGVPEAAHNSSRQQSGAGC